MIYLDHAAATPVSPTVRRAMEPYLSDAFFNPSATYLPARQVRVELQAARQSVAAWLGARSGEIVFTAGGTEANNLAIQGVLARYPQSSVVTSAVEHDSVLAPVRRFSRFSEVSVTTDGRVIVDVIRQAITDDTVLVSVMYANNEVGTIQPLRDIAELLQEVRRDRRQAGNDLPLYFHTDACQAANYLDLHVSRLGIDMMTLNGGKMYGPKQTGALYIAGHVQLEPLLLGGGQERNRRSGTENVPGIIGFAAALDEAQEKRREETKRLTEVQKKAFDLCEQKIPGCMINGSRKHRLPNNIHITIPGQDNERLIVELEQRGILVAAGSACSASSEEPSHVLRAMGVRDHAARSSLRLTMGRQTTEQDVRTVIETLAEIVTT